MGVRVRVANFFLGQLLGIDVTTTFQLNFFSSMESVGHRFGRLMGVRVGVAYSRNKLALRTKSKSGIPILCLR